VDGDGLVVPEGVDDEYADLRFTTMSTLDRSTACGGGVERSLSAGGGCAPCSGGACDLGAEQRRRVGDAVAARAM
jgi:hypothetical protein